MTEIINPNRPCGKKLPSRMLFGGFSGQGDSGGEKMRKKTDVFDEFGIDLSETDSMGSGENDGE